MKMIPIKTSTKWEKEQEVRLEQFFMIWLSQFFLLKFYCLISLCCYDPAGWYKQKILLEWETRTPFTFVSHVLCFMYRKDVYNQSERNESIQVFQLPLHVVQCSI